MMIGITFESLKLTGKLEKRSTSKKCESISAERMLTCSKFNSEIVRPSFQPSTVLKFMKSQY